jgi:hypothetical protein
MSKTSFILEKLNFNSTKDIIDAGIVMLANQKQTPSIHNFKEKLFSPMTQIVIKNQTLLTPLIEEAANKLKGVINNNSQFQNGLYKLVVNDQTIGIFGFKIDEVKDGKIFSCSSSSFIHPDHLQKGKLFGSQATASYYKDVLLKNTNEFHKDAKFEIPFLNDNITSVKFQQSLGLDKVSKVEKVDKNISVARGKMTDFINSAQNFVNKMEQSKIIKPRL